MAAMQEQAEWSGISPLMDTGEYSDLKLVCKGAEFKVHKAVVCYQSPVMAAACGHGLQGTEKDVIHIQDFEPRTTKQMLEFMYTGDYTISIDSESRAQLKSGTLPRAQTRLRRLEARNTARPQNITVVGVSFNRKKHFSNMDLPKIGSQLAELLLEQIRVDAIAGYYDLPELRKLANAKGKLILEEKWDNKRFLTIVQEALKLSKDVSLCKLMAEIATAHIEELLKDDHFARMGIIDDFAFAIITNLVAKRRKQEKWCADRVEALRTQLYVAELGAELAENDKEQYEDYA